MPSWTHQIDKLEFTGPTLPITLSLPDKLMNALSENKRKKVLPVQITALIDTGASSTVIKQEIIQKFSIKPIGVVKIGTPSSTNYECYVYPVKMVLNNGIVIPDMTAIAAPLQDQNIQALIGRDILKHSVFIYTGYVNQFTIAF